MSFASRVFAAVALISVPLSAQAALAPVLEISGQVAPFSSPGAYTLDIFATAIDSPQVVGGFNITLDFSDPNLTFASVAYSFGTPGPPVSPGADPAQLQTTDLSLVGLPVGVGQNVPLASITFNASAPGNVPISIGEVNDQFVGPIDASVNPLAPALSLTPTNVPEPSSLAALASLGLLSGALRRRRKPIV